MSQIGFTRNHGKLEFFSVFPRVFVAFPSHVVHSPPESLTVPDRDRILQASSGAQPAKPETLRFAEELANNVSSSVKDRMTEKFWKVYHGLLTVLWS